MNTQSRLSQIFNAMKSRCYNHKNTQYKDYGGRGVKLCDEWNDRKKKGYMTKGFISFKEWALTHGYQDNLTIDRIDVNKGYSPDNCRWVTLKEQANNKTNNHFVTYKGKTQSLKKWAEELDLNYNTIRQRLNQYHFSVEKTFEIKDNLRLKMIEYNGKKQSLSAWCKELKLNYDKVKQRLNKLNWSVEKSFNCK